MSMTLGGESKFRNQKLHRFIEWSNFEVSGNGFKCSSWHFLYGTLHFRNYSETSPIQVIKLYRHISVNCQYIEARVLHNISIVDRIHNHIHSTCS